jgi:hypothetical protein
LKVHLRCLALCGVAYRVVTLRPATDVYFSTNYYHNTWHIVSDERGSRLLARLLWGLSYQRHPGTMVLLHGPHLRPTPFDGAPSDPVLLVPAGLTPRKDAFRQLKGRLGRLGQPHQTIRWHTFGLDVELHAEATGAGENEGDVLYRAENDSLWQGEQMGRCGGFICYTAPAPILRQRARQVHGMHVRGNPFWSMDYRYLVEHPLHWEGPPDGEVQIFADYRQRLSAAVQARKEVLARPDRPSDPETLEEVISRRRDTIRRARQRSRGPVSK